MACKVLVSINFILNSHMKISYNSPVILTYSLICLIVLSICQILPDNFSNLFVLRGGFNWSSIEDYFGLFSYVFGHKTWDHFLGNISFILLIGPVLEEKYGSRQMVGLIFLTAIISALVNVAFFGNNIIGASGIVFMMILLSSFTGMHEGEIPLTFILIFIIYIGKEIMASFHDDHISQYAHIIGGICGGFFGFYLNKNKSNRETREDDLLI